MKNKRLQELQEIKVLSSNLWGKTIMSLLPQYAQDLVKSGLSDPNIEHFHIFNICNS